MIQQEIVSAGEAPLLVESKDSPLEILRQTSDLWSDAAEALARREYSEFDRLISGLKRPELAEPPVLPRRIPSVAAS